MEDLALWFVIAVALAFDFTNGFHDAANSIATIVATRVLSPRYAVIWAAFFNFVAFLVFKTHVASTIAKGVVEQDVLSIGVIFAGLVGAIAWNMLTWYLGLPSSSSHALVGGIVGAAVAKSGFGAVVASGLSRIGVFIVLAPLIGLALGFVVMLLVLQFSRTAHNVDRLNRGFRKMQLVSAGAYSLGHGGNDAQKTMGVILALLIATGHVGAQSDVPLWVVLSAHSAIALGTLSGGWRIVHTMGSKITRLTPMQGCAAETGGAITLFMATNLGVPVSTTHTITGAIIGVGAVRRTRAVRWGVAGNIVVAWVVTIPASALVAALAYWAVGAVASVLG